MALSCSCDHVSEDLKHQTALLLLVVVIVVVFIVVVGGLRWGGLMLQPGIIVAGSLASEAAGLFIPWGSLWLRRSPRLCSTAEDEPILAPQQGFVHSCRTQMFAFNRKSNDFVGDTRPYHGQFFVTSIGGRSKVIYGQSHTDKSKPWIRDLWSDEASREPLNVHDKETPKPLFPNIGCLVVSRMFANLLLCVFVSLFG